MLCDIQRDRLHYICCTMNLFEWILNLLYGFGKPFHGGTKINIILALPPRSMAAQPTFWPPVTGSTHIPPLFVSFSAGIYVHTTYEYAHSLCSFFSSSPRDGKNIRPAVKGVRNGEHVKERMVEKVNRFQLPKLLRKAPKDGGMRWDGERERERERRQQVLLSLSQPGVRSKPSPPPLPTYQHTHTYIQAQWREAHTRYQ